MTEANGEQEPQSLTSQLQGFIQDTMAKFPNDVGESSRFRVQGIELEAEGIISALVTRKLDGTPEAVTVFRPGEEDYKQYEDYYCVHEGQVKVETILHNTSGQSTIGFGTERPVGVKIVDADGLKELKVLLKDAKPHSNPQSKLFR